MQRPSQPAAQRELRRWNNEVLLRDLGAEAGEGAENAQPAGDENEDSDGVQPMRHAHDQRMFVSNRKGAELPAYW